MSSEVNAQGPLPRGYAPDPGAVAAPDLTQTPSVALEQWDAACSADGCGKQVVAACFRASAGTWSPEVDDLVHGKLADVTSNAAYRARGDGSLHVASVAPGQRVLEGDGLAAKTLVGFTSGGAVHACFVACIGPRGAAAPCREYVDAARLTGPIVAAPETSASLAAVVAMVHHPRETFVCFVAFVCAMGLAAIALRPRPRRRASRPRYSPK